MLAALLTNSVAFAGYYAATGYNADGTTSDSLPGWLRLGDAEQPSKRASASGMTDMRDDELL